jgi:hypothetical protein
MDPIFLIHNAARHYCIDGFARWSQRYKELCTAGGNQVTESDGSWTYTVEAHGIFPRYQVLQAILAEIEGFIPADFKSVDEVRTILAAAQRQQRTTSPDSTMRLLSPPLRTSEGLFGHLSLELNSTNAPRSLHCRSGEFLPRKITRSYIWRSQPNGALGMAAAQMINFSPAL